MLTKLIEGIASSWKQSLPRKVKSRDAILKVQTKTLIARKSQLTTPATVWPPVIMSPLLRLSFRIYQSLKMQFSPVDNKVKELIRPIALPELLGPLHIETRVELHNPDVLVVVRTTAWPGCARHHVASVHRIGSDLFKENYSPTVSERMSSPWLPGPCLQCRWSGRFSGFPPGRRSRPWRCPRRWWRDTRPRSRQCIRLPQGCPHLGEFLGCPRFHRDLDKNKKIESPTFKRQCKLLRGHVRQWIRWSKTLHKKL